MPDSRNFSSRRRAIIRGLAGGVSGLALSQWSRAARAADDIVASAVAPDITMLSGGGGNVLVLATGDGQVLVDSGAAASASALQATLGELPGGRVTALFNTHWHLDQVGSNATLGQTGATIFAHAKTRLRLSTGYYVPTEERYAAALPATGLPTETFYTNGTTTIDGHAIEYGHLIAAHTDGDIYVSFRDRNVIAVGDVISPVRDPVFDWFGGGWLGGRVDALARLLELGDINTRFVPSHGPLVNRTELQAEHDMMLEFFERMVEHVRLGESAKDMVEAGVLDGLGRSFSDPYRLLYDTHKGMWAHHNKLMPDIV